MKGLTVKQQQIYDFICQHQEERGYPPTIREIGLNFNLNSTGSVRDYLHALEKKGFINRNLRTSRGIEILKKTIIAKTRSIPIYGSIAAGAPTVAALGGRWGRCDGRPVWPNSPPLNRAPTGIVTI